MSNRRVFLVKAELSQAVGGSRFVAPTDAETGTPHDQPPIDRKVHMLIRAICDDLSRTWTVKDMAHLTGLTLGYLQTFVKLKTGLTPKELEKWLKMQAAAEQLSDPDCLLSIKQIARLVGYDDQAHFTKVFKQICAQTPTEFRDRAMIEFQSKYRMQGTLVSDKT